MISTFEYYVWTFSFVSPGCSKCVQHKLSCTSNTLPPRYWVHDLHQLGQISGHGASAPAAVFTECEGCPPGLLPGLGSGLPGGGPPAVPQHAARAPGEADLHGVL